jgi:hypothetical protein
LWKKCPLAYKYTYVDKIADRKSNIHLVFGSALHDVLEAYLYVEYNKRKITENTTVNNINISSYIIKNDTGKGIKDFNTSQMLFDRMYHEVQKLSEEQKDESINLDKMNELYQDGIEICEYLKKRRADWFTLRGWELVDIEFELKEQLKDGLNFIGYIDVLLKDPQDTYHIIDLKTSTAGWKDYHKKDKDLTDQNLIYKHYLSNKLNIPIEKIKVEYVVLKRKVPEDPDYPAQGRRVQRFIPTDGKVSMNRAFTEFNHFVNTVFNDDGSRTTDGYEPKPSKNNCKYCEFNQKNICKYAIN